MSNGKKQRNRLVGAAVAAAVTSSLIAQFADAATYTGAAADGLFATGTNWSTSAAPGSSGYTGSTDTATFANATPNAITVDANRNIQFLTINQSGSTPPSYTFTGGPLLLTSGGSILVSATSVSQTINTPLVLEGDGGSYSIETDTPGTSRTLSIGGAISGVSSTGNVTALTLTGTSTGINAIGGAITDGTVGGKLSITKSGTGTFNLNGTNTYSGGTTITGGTLVTGNATPSSTLGSGAITLNGGTLRLSATSSTFTNPLNLGTTGGFISTKGDSFQPSAITGTGPLSIGIDSAATFTPSTFQSYAGVINLNANSGNVTYRLGTSLTNFDATSLQNASLNLGAGVTVNRGFATNVGQTVNIGSLAGVAGSVLTGGTSSGAGFFTYNIGGNNGSSTFAGVISDGSTKTALTKAGSGGLTLSGTNTYTGATTVTAGTLFIDGTNSGASATTVALTGILGGNGTNAGAVTDNGTIAPGATASSIGTLTLSGGAMFNDGSTFAVDYNASGSDLLSTTNLSLTGSDTLSLNALDATTTGVYIIAAYTGTESGAFTNVPANAVVDYGTGSNSVITVTISPVSIPEPASLSMLGLAGVGLLRRRSQRIAGMI